MEVSGMLMYCGIAIGCIIFVINLFKRPLITIGITLLIVGLFNLSNTHNSLYLALSVLGLGVSAFHFFLK
jgi:hypothetical protein